MKHVRLIVALLLALSFGVKAGGVLADSQPSRSLTAGAFTMTASGPIPATNAIIGCNATNGAINYTMPPAKGTGEYVTIIKTDSSANACTVVASGSDTIVNASNATLITQGTSAKLYSTGLGTWTVEAALAAAFQGGNGDAVGRIANIRNVKTTTSTGSTTANLLVVAFYQSFPNNTTFNTALTTSTFVRGIAQSTVGAGAAFQMVAYGPSLCVYDGQTTVGDAVTISSTVAGDCHDSGSSAVPAAGTQLVGYVLAANAGAGTTANTFVTISPNSAGNVCTFAKCVAPAANVSCGAGTANWTAVCSATLGPLPNDPGPSNGTFFVAQSSVYAVIGATKPTAMDWRLNVTCGGNNSTDPHGVPAAGIPAANSVTQLPVLSALTFSAKDINPNGCTAEFDCIEGASDAAGDFQILATTTQDSNSISVDSAMLVGWCQGDIP